MNQKTMAHYWWVFWLVSVFSISLYWHLDARPLIDLGRYYQSIPDWMMWFEHPNPMMIWQLLRQFGGWLNAILALGVWLTNGPEFIFMFYAVITSGLFWWALRHWPVWTAVFLLMQPIWQVGWRTQWIHALETSLILVVWQFWRRNRLNKWTGLLSMLAVWLRPSALIWLGALWLWDCFHHKETRRHHWILVGMMVATLLISPQLSAYVSGKLSVPRISVGLWYEVGRHGGWMSTLLMIGIILYRRRTIQDSDWMLVGWILGGTGLATLFGVGIDNFPLMFAGLAMLAGQLEFSKWGGRGLIALAGACNVVSFIESLPSQFSYGFHPNSIIDTEYDFQRPIRQVTAYPNPIDIQDVLEQVCANKRPHCLVVTIGELFHPHRESQGRLALLSEELMHLRIEKSELWFRRNEQFRFVDAVIVQDCDANDVWLHQFHRYAKEFESHVRDWQVVETLQVAECRWMVKVPLINP